MAEIIRENEGAIEIKSLGKPKRNTVLDSSYRMSDEEAELASLNGGVSGGRERPLSSREIAAQSQKKTILGNHGPNKDGSVDWAKNPDCVDYILQKHESSGNGDTPEGYFATAQKCSNQFNKLFKTRVTAEMIVQGLSQHNTPGARPGRVAEASAPAQTAVAPVVAQQPVENFYPLDTDELQVEIRSDVVQRVAAD